MRRLRKITLFCSLRDVNHWTNNGFKLLSRSPYPYLTPDDDRGAVLVGDPEALNKLNPPKKFVAILDYGVNANCDLVVCDGETRFNLCVDPITFLPIIRLDYSGCVDPDELERIRLNMIKINDVMCLFGVGLYQTIEATHQAHTFKSKEAAEAFAKGLEYVNDAAIDDIKVQKTGKKWTVTFIDDDADKEDAGINDEDI